MYLLCVQSIPATRKSRNRVKRLFILALLASSLSGGEASFVARVTFYCNEGPGGCVRCCGKWARLNRTASGVVPKRFLTCAASRKYPFGTLLEIEGIGRRVVQDRLAERYDSRVDVFVGSDPGAHKRALRLGARERKVRVVRWGP